MKELQELELKFPWKSLQNLPNRERQKAEEALAEVKRLKEEVDRARNGTERFKTQVVEEQEEKDPESPGVQKRIGKLIERANTAESRAQELEELLKKLEDQKEDAPVDKGIDTGYESRFEGIHDVAELDKREADAEHLRAWLLQNSEGGSYSDRSGAEHEVDYEVARRLMVDTDLDLRKNIPKAREEAAARNANLLKAKQEFTWMNDSNSPESIDVAAMLRESPRLKKFYDSDPFAPILLGYAQEGFRSRLSQERNAVKKKIPKAPTSPSSSRAAPVSRKPKEDNSDLLNKAVSTGSPEDAEAYIESIL